MLQFLIAFSISLNGGMNSSKIDIPANDYHFGAGFQMWDDRFSYETKREDGKYYYSLISNMDLITSTQFHLLPIKSVWYLEGNVYDREAQDIAVENITVGGCAYLKGIQFRIGGGVSYDGYKDGEPCVYSELRYCKQKEANVWQRILSVVMVGSDYDIVVSGLFSRSRAQYKFNTYNSFHLSSMVDFQINSEYFKDKVEDYKMVNMGIAIKL